jgi:hypothetical protein
MIDLDTKEAQRTELIAAQPRVTHIVGTASAAQTIKQLWHDAKPGVSLKVFARQLLKSKDDKSLVAREWLSNKAGNKNAKRSEANIKRLTLERAATKSAKKAKQPGGAK